MKSNRVSEERLHSAAWRYGMSVQSDYAGERMELIGRSGDIVADVPAAYSVGHGFARCHSVSRDRALWLLREMRKGGAA